MRPGDSPTFFVRRVTTIRQQLLDQTRSSKLVTNQLLGLFSRGEDDAVAGLDHDQRNTGSKPPTFPEFSGHDKPPAITHHDRI